MKEISLFTLASRVDATIETLGQLGVVEIREVEVAEEKQFDALTDKIGRVEKAIALLQDHQEKTGYKNGDPSDTGDPLRLANRILKSIDVEKKCRETLDELSSDLAWYRMWGEKVDIKDFKYLKERGIDLKLYLLDEAEVDQLPDLVGLVKFPPSENKIPLAHFQRTGTDSLGLREEAIPHLHLNAVKRQLSRKERQMDQVDLFRKDQLRNIPVLKDYLAYLNDRLSHRRALAGLGNIDGYVKYLKGYLPDYAVEDIKKAAQEHAWGFQVGEPENDDDVPVYIKNPKWISIINPVMKFIDIVPGYKEVDVSIYFLVAFALFFAMLVGDAGYGALFLLTAFLLRKSLAPQLRILIYVLSGATMVWGILSGTYFGSEVIAGWPVLKDLVVPSIASFGVDNISFMMHLSFVIGAIHLTIAHSIRIAQFINSTKALSEVGWIAFIWGLFFVAEKLVLGKAVPPWNTWLFVAGFVLVVLFSQTGKTLWSSILSSIANLPLSLINGFSDIVSYVRLFAVGMATATVASSFNTMILPAGGDLSFLGIIIAIIALTLGHGLNIVLALMAVMVHGIRLNMLEFSGHLGVLFSGEAYKPFTLKTFQKKASE